MDVFCFGPYRLVAVERTLWAPNGPVRLGSRAFDILVVLLRRAGQTVSHKELMELVWPNTYVAENTLRVHIAALRKALGDALPGFRYIVNISGVGYSLAVPVACTPLREPAAFNSPLYWRYRRMARDRIRRRQIGRV